MDALSEQPLACPYCGEEITILVDASLPDQTYIEDCQVCCRPIVIGVEIVADDIRIRAHTDTE